MASQQNFAAQVSDWVAATKERTEAVFKQSSMEVISEMIRLTPVDTGFLRASITVSLNGPAPMNRPKGAGGSAPSYAMTIAGADLGSTIYATYGANYAAFVEYGTSKMQARAMVRLSAQQWPAIVSRVAARAKSSAGSR